MENGMKEALKVLHPFICRGYGNSGINHFTKDGFCHCHVGRKVAQLNYFKEMTKMLERLEKELKEIEQEHQTVTGQIQQLNQALMQCQQRQFQLQGAHERLTKLIAEVKNDAAQDSSGTDRPVEASEVRDNQDVPAII